ncbi:MAG: hypothetical protein M1824_002583 [Vezdaea acicularis]|nr:MAG: hypothetical protein M1824_002583 [Vezdaea acicularis]
MSDFLPPTGPPPPKVPEGWKAIYNTEYKEWFYVNTYTKVSTWDKPSSPALPPSSSEHLPPSGPPPSYTGSGPPTTTEKDPTNKNNPFTKDTPQPHDLDADEAFARKLQAEEDARANPTTAASKPGGNTPDARGASSDYYNNSGPSNSNLQPPYGSAPGLEPEQGSSGTGKSSKSGGLLGKLLGKATGRMSGAGAGASGAAAYGHPQQQGYGYGGGYGQQQQGYGPQQPGYGPGYGQQAPPRKSGGMGMLGAGALGVGGGLLAGGLLAEGLDHDDNNGYGNDGGYGSDGGYGGGGGDDYGGGDFGGGGDF